jgi:hypothetical protein
MLDMIGWYALVHIAVDAALIAVARLATATDENQCFEDFRMVQAQLQANHATDANTEKNRFARSFLTAHGNDVFT